MWFTDLPSAASKSAADTSLSDENSARPVATAVALRSSQSSENRKPALLQRSRLSRSSCRASGHSAQILASARSPLESLVPPELTLLKMSTTTSTVLSAPVIFSELKSRFAICVMRFNRSR